MKVPLLTDQAGFFIDIYPTLSNKNKFNLVKVISLPSNTRVDVGQAAASEIWLRHDALRATFHLEPAGGWVQSVSTGGETPLLHVSVNSVEQEDRRALVENLVMELQNTLNIQNGPLCRFLIVSDRGVIQNLIFIAHHLVCDEYSLSVIARDFKHLVSSGPSIDAIGIADYSAAVQTISEFAHSAEVIQSLPYWKSTIPESVPGLHREITHSPENVPQPETVEVRLHPGLSSFVLRELPAMLSMTLQEVALGLVCSIVSNAFEPSDVAIQVMHNGRTVSNKQGEFILPPAVRRTVGWFAATGLVVVPAGRGTISLISRLLVTRDLYRATPSAGVPFTMLRHLSAISEIRAEIVDKRRAPAIWFNYVPNDGGRDLVGEPSDQIALGAAVDPLFRGSPLAFQAVTTSEDVTFYVTCEVALFGRGFARRMADELVQATEKVQIECLSLRGQLAPSAPTEHKV